MVKSKTALHGHVEKLEKHAATCAHCQKGGPPCPAGQKLFDEVVRFATIVLMECFQWHTKRFKGIGRMTKVAKALLVGGLEAARKV